MHINETNKKILYFNSILKRIRDLMGDNFNFEDYFCCAYAFLESIEPWNKYIFLRFYKKEKVVMFNLKLCHSAYDKTFVLNNDGWIEKVKHDYICIYKYHDGTPQHYGFRPHIEQELMACMQRLEIEKALADVAVVGGDNRKNKRI